MRTQRGKAAVSAFLRTPISVAVTLAFAQGASAGIITVTNANSSGAGSLYQAISDANANCATDASPVIQFSGPFVISPSFTLPPFPQFFCPTGVYNPTIDAWPTPTAVQNTDGTGFNATLPVVINMSSYMYGGYCVFDNSSGYGGTLTVKGVEVRDYAYGGGGTAACGVVNLQGNRFVNTGMGANLSPGSYVGGTAPGSRNVIANMSGVAIRLGSSSTVDHNVVNNLLGTLDGVTAAANYTGIVGNCCDIRGTISSNVIVTGQYGGGISLTGDNMTIDHNKIGTDAGGTNLLGAGQYGIALSYSYGSHITNNTIAGQQTAIANTGDSFFGTSDNVVISGNTIGGNSSLANVVGIFDGYSYGTRIDGTNVIAGNSDIGLMMGCATNATVDNNTFSNNGFGGIQLAAVKSGNITNNRIGSSGGNNGDGIRIVPGSCNSPSVAAPTPPSAKALIAGSYTESDGNRFADNTIANNAGMGIQLIGGSGNTFFDNTIFSNRADGLRIDSHCCDPTYGGNIADAVGNSMMLNRVYANGGKNINLGFDGGVLPNDANDADSGKPNNWQNFPVLNSAIHDTGNNRTDIGFTLDSKAGQYQIDFYSNPSPSIVPAGQTYMGNKSITLAADGPTSDSFSVTGTTWDNITAVATRVGPEASPVQDSSEYANEVTASLLPVPGVNIIPTSIDFGDVVVGRSSGSSSISVMSQGTADYVINALRDTTCTGPAICSTGAFICSTTCAEATPYRPGQSCTITASFAPTALGSQTKVLALCDNTGTNKTLSLAGNGVPPPTVDIAYTPSFFSFGEVLVGTQGPAHGFTLTNAGATQVYLSPVSVNGDFVITGNTCGATLGGGASCETEVAFAPATKGGQNGTLQVTGSITPPAAASRSKVTSSPTTVASALLQGSGAQFGELRLPSSISFGVLVLHGSPSTQTVQLNNTGNGPITISGISVSGPFTMTHDCGTSLAVGSSCSVSLKFNPTTLGSFSGTLTVLTDASGGSRTIALGAEVVADARPVVRVNPITMGFGERLIGSATPASRVTVTNEGAQVAALGPIGFVQPETGKSEYSISNTTCTLSLAAQATCFVDIVFTPLGFGSRAGQLLVPSNSADSPRTVNLGGTGCRPFVAGMNRATRDPCAP